MTQRYSGIACLVIVAIVSGIVVASAAAQTQPAAPRWQLEGFGGLSLFDLPKDGTATLPPIGASLITSGPTNPTRRVSTWFLGDGAQILNGVNAEFGIPARISPLDAVISTLSLSGTNAPAFGLRLRRIVSDRIAVEFSADMMPGSRELSPELMAAVEQARGGFVSAFNGLLATGPFSNINVSATATTTNNSARDLATTLAAQWMFKSGAFEPYLALGGGLVHRMGDLPAVTVMGTYRFTIGGTVPINETDVLTLRYDQGTAVIGLVGAGVRRTLNDRFGFSVDGRVFLGQQTLTLRLDSTPTVTTGTPAGFIESFTTPAIQFSNNSSTGRTSTLSGEPLNAFKAFTTNGRQTRYIVSAGVFVRF